jgi:FKBP-type peptidyl-prolyl cis-trans isomerase (trigger factor)
MTFDGYLKQINKTESDIQKEWRESAIKRAKLELILKHIARKEKIEPKAEDIKKEVDHIMSHHKTADRFKARMYVENSMVNQMVFEFLEG